MEDFRNYPCYLKALEKIKDERLLLFAQIWAESAGDSPIDSHQAKIQQFETFFFGKDPLSIVGRKYLPVVGAEKFRELLKLWSAALSKPSIEKKGTLDEMWGAFAEETSKLRNHIRILTDMNTRHPVERLFFRDALVVRLNISLDSMLKVLATRRKRRNSRKIDELINQTKKLRILLR